MSLKAAFQKAAQTAFGAAGNVPVEVRYDSYVTATNDISTGVVEKQYARYMVSVIFETYDDRMIDGIRVMSGDKRTLIPSLNLPVSPSTRDQIQVLEDGVWRKHAVVNKETDPAEAMWTIQARRL